MLQGYRTKIWAALASLPTTLNTLVGQLDPEVVSTITTEFPVVILMYQAVTLLGTYYYYDNKQEKPNEETSIEFDASIVNRP